LMIWWFDDLMIWWFHDFPNYVKIAMWGQVAGYTRYTPPSDTQKCPRKHWPRW
jgi:hypothetical protein